MLYGHYVAPIVPQIVKSHRTDAVRFPLGSKIRDASQQPYMGGTLGVRSVPIYFFGVD